MFSKVYTLATHLIPSRIPYMAIQLDTHMDDLQAAHL